MRKIKKATSMLLAGAMALSLAACTGTSSETDSTDGSTQAQGTSAGNEDDSKADSSSQGETKEEGGDAKTLADGLTTFDQIQLGTDYTDVTASIKVLTHRTDIVDGKLKEYAEAFNKLYPNITVTYEGITDYAETALLRLSNGGWGDIMMIPAIQKSELSNFFIPFGSVDTLSEDYRYVDSWAYEDQVYGIASVGNFQGIVYNKAVFEEAGITEIPSTPSEYIDALTKISENTDAIPLYTNYADGWTMGAWDAYIGVNATGDATYMNQKLSKLENPFRNYGDDTHAYAVYKILYDAVENGLIEDDYTTTDWEGCKAMINNGEIGTMVLGSWAIPQMQLAGDHADDIGYMPFPISVDGKVYTTEGPDYSYGIANDASVENQIASMLYVKWLTDQSGFATSEAGIPISKAEALPAGLDGVEFLIDEPALSGEEDLFDTVNSESGLGINAGGNDKIMEIVECAYDGSKTYDEIMEEWNAAWTDAQDYCDVETITD